MSGNLNIFSCWGIRDEGWFILKGILGILFIAVVGGSMLSWIIFPIPSMICLPSGIKTLALRVRVLGAWMGYQFSLMNYRDNLIKMKFIIFTVFCGSIWFIPFIRTRGIYIQPIKVGSSSLKSFDQGWCEYMGAQGIYSFFKNTSIFNQLVQNNFLKIYLIFFIIWISLLLFIFYLNSLFKA
jgi:hypothetical protein